SSAHHEGDALEGHGQALSDGRHPARFGRGITFGGRSFGERHTQRSALRPSVEGAATGGRTRSRNGLRRALFRQERYQHDQAGGIQTKFRVDAKRPGLHYTKSSSMSNGEKYYGKYRGTVLNNVDPLQIGRLMVQVPDV